MTDTQPSVVYAVRCGALIKIGTTSDFSRRLANLQTANGTPLELVCVGPGGRDLEAFLHQIFQHRRRRGEWFDLSDEDVLTLKNAVPSDRTFAMGMVTQKQEQANREHRCRAVYSEEVPCSVDPHVMHSRCSLWLGHWGQHNDAAHVQWSDQSTSFQWRPGDDVFE